MDEIFKDLPCTEITCLKFPVCRHKLAIYCHDLAMWICLQERLYEKGMDKMFPNLDHVVSPINTEGRRLFAQRLRFETIDGWWTVTAL